MHRWTAARRAGPRSGSGGMSLTSYSSLPRSRQQRTMRRMCDLRLDPSRLCAVATQRAVQPVEMRYRHSHGAELLLHFAAEQERALVEEDVAALAVNLGKERRLDQAVAVVESGELHRLVLDRVHRLGGGQHARHQD